MRDEVIPIVWLCSALADLKKFPSEVRRAVGYALDRAQRGAKHDHAKALKGFGGAGVLEIVESHEGNAYNPTC